MTSRTVTLYRAVEADELADFSAQGQFAWGPVPTGMKQFGLDLKETRTFAATHPAYIAVIEVVVGRQEVQGAHFSRTIDAHIFKAGVYTFHDLADLNAAIQSFHIR